MKSGRSSHDQAVKSGGFSLTLPSGTKVTYTPTASHASHIMGVRFAGPGRPGRWVRMNSLRRVIRAMQAFGHELSRRPNAAVPKRMPSIGIALGGGFARGIAHIGVLKV